MAKAILIYQGQVVTECDESVLEEVKQEFVNTVSALCSGIGAVELTVIIKPE